MPYRAKAVRLLLGESEDPWCLSVRAALEARHHPTRIIANPLVHPARFAWQLNDAQSVSRLVWGKEPPVLDEHIAGVFVRSAGWIDPAGWQPPSNARHW